MTQTRKKHNRALRSRYEALLAPIGHFVARTGISPNFVSILAVLMSVASAIAFATGSIAFGLLFMVFSSWMDMLDGSIARAKGQATPFGQVFDHTLDRYAEFFFLLGILLGGYVDGGWILFTLFGMVMGSFIRAKAESVDRSINCSVGIAERKEKLFTLAFGAGLQWFYENVQSFSDLWSIVPFGFNPLTAAVVIVGVLSHISALQRLKYAHTNM
ncbi:MAG: CDP-alcohol phosphatidyltransferase family protein [Candidatus Heimdallarchaeota archaeon]